MAHRVCAIDIGTNTVLLLVAEGPAARPTAILERATITRLGAGVDRTNVLLEEAMGRTLAALQSCRAVFTEHGVTSTDIVCTSAARDARNGGEFLDRAESILGVRPRIIDGEEEARLTFEGALSGLDVSGPVRVFDVGGGSTEIIAGTVVDDVARVEGTVSLDIGSVRLTERHIRSDPPTSQELANVRADVDRALSTISGSLLPRTRPAPAPLIGVAGTVTTLAAMAQALPVYDSALVHGSHLSLRDVVDLEGKLATVGLTERRTLSGLEPGRADVIVAGTVLVHALLDWLDAGELLVSDRGVRWGLARRLLLALEPTR